MKFVVFAGLVALAFCSYAVFDSRSLMMMDSSEADRELFDRFMSRHNVFFVSESEKDARFKIFSKNLERARMYEQMDNGDATYGVHHDGRMSPYLHLSPEEFKASHLSSFKKTPTQGTVKASGNDLPKTFNWLDHDGVVNPIKNQGQCGSCWAFSTVQNIESFEALKTGNLKSYSEQQLVDCSLNFKEKSLLGCDGGLMDVAEEWYIENNFGTMLEEDYPYEARDGKCRQETAKMHVFPKQQKNIDPTVDAVKDALVNVAPLAAALNAEWMQFYTGGVSDPAWCNPKALDHAIGIVGYDVTTKHGKELPYWIIRNSWGTGWGEKGYYKLAMGKCGIENYVCTVTEI